MRAINLHHVGRALRHDIVGARGSALRGTLQRCMQG
jgi:hypothetical protein